MRRGDAEALDRVDPVARMRDEFDLASGGGAIYMNGNSLGPPPRAVPEAISDAVVEWGKRLVGGWDEWIDLPARVGDRLGRLVGAAAGQIAVCDSTTVNLYKVAASALGDRPERDVIVGSAGDFPTDRYVLQGLAAATGRRLRLVDDPDLQGPAEDRLVEAFDHRTALVCLSHIDFRTGRRLDAAAVTAAAHRAGALIVWDLAHSAGSFPVRLDEWEADLAVGCTYKYLNAGPGAPGFLYVRAEIQDRLRQPIWGWFGQAEPFAMGPRYEPARGIASFLTGTPGVVGLRAVEAALAVTAAAGVERLWAKSEALTSLLIDRADERLGPLGARVVTPRDPSQRGAHVSIAHPSAWPWCRALIERDLVVSDFRPPDVIRLGPAPLYTRHVDCFDAIERMADTLAGGVDDRAPLRRVT
jgi:kynureninase